jgi:hypothetical protein
MFRLGRTEYTDAPAVFQQDKEKAGGTRGARAYENPGLSEESPGMMSTSGQPYLTISIFLVEANVPAFIL